MLNSVRNILVFIVMAHNNGVLPVCNLRRSRKIWWKGKQFPLKFRPHMDVVPTIVQWKPGNNESGQGVAKVVRRSITIINLTVTITYLDRDKVQQSAHTKHPWDLSSILIVSVLMRREVAQQDDKHCKLLYEI